MLQLIQQSDINLEMRGKFVKIKVYENYVYFVILLIFLMKDIPLILSFC